MLKSLTVSQFRCMDRTFSFSPGVNIIHGKNGSGKSTLLEAIHLLSFGRSFRAGHPEQMVQHDTQGYVVRAEIEKNGYIYQASVARQSGLGQAKLNGDSTTLAKISLLLPTLFMDCDSHRNYFNIAADRRRLFDWLLFHVEPGYVGAMRAYKKALQQRNAALKNRLSTTAWDALLSTEAEKIHTMRQNICALLSAWVKEARYDLQNTVLDYTPGYDTSGSLLDDLSRHLERDRMSGRTSVGPHKADFKLHINGVNAVHVLSQGQQKVLFLKLMLLHRDAMIEHSVTPLILIDDVPAELDAGHRKLIQALLSHQDEQAIVTAIHLEDLNWVEGPKVFHVEQSAVS